MIESLFMQQIFFRCHLNEDELLENAFGSFFSFLFLRLPLYPLHWKTVGGEFVESVTGRLNSSSDHWACSSVCWISVNKDGLSIRSTACSSSIQEIVPMRKWGVSKSVRGRWKTGRPNQNILLVDNSLARDNSYGGSGEFVPLLGSQERCSG